MTARPPSPQGDLFHQKRKPPNGRQATIAEYVKRQQILAGKTPTVNEVAKLFATSESRVRVHFKALGLVR